MFKRHGLKWVWIGVFFVWGTPVWAQDEIDSDEAACAESVNQNYLNTENKRYVKLMKAWVIKQKRLPDQIELATLGDLEPEQVTEYFEHEDTPSDVSDLLKLCFEEVPDLKKNLVKSLARTIATYAKENLSLPTQEEISVLSGTPLEELGELYGDVSDAFSILNEHSPQTISVVSNKLVSTYLKVAKHYGRSPTIDQIAEALESSEEALASLIGPNRAFESLDDVKDAAQKKTPSAFKQIIDESLVTPERQEALLNAIKNRSRLIVTTAVSGSPVHKEFFESLLKYAKTMDAEIVVFPANMVTNELDPILLETPGVHIITNSVKLNPWLQLNKIRVLAKAINPLMGLDRLAERGESLIVGSPKQHVKVLPTGNNSVYPHKQMTTGAVTVPNYSGEKWIQGRTDEIAAHDHVMGAIILEKSSSGDGVAKFEMEGNYHARHIEYMEEENGFMDLGYFYTGKSRRKVRPEALVLGDIHVGDTDQKVLATIREQILTLKPKYIVLHDLFNGHSISHHDLGKAITMGQKAKSGRLDLEKELRRVVNMINAIMAIDSSLKVVVVPSNHDNWLHQWLQAGQFMKEPYNMELGLELAKAFHDKTDPFKVALDKFGVESPKRMIFVEIGNGFKVGKRGRWVQVGQHGHKGANGAKASLKSMQRAYGRIVFGHTHTYGRLNGAVNVGTITKLILGYNKEGHSNWLQSFAVVGPNGEIQVLEFQDNQWYSKDKVSKTTPEAFFPEEFPEWVPNNESNDSGQIDQYN